MKPINAEEIIRVFNGWLEEADSLAEREAIECCIDLVVLMLEILEWFSRKEDERLERLKNEKRQPKT